MQTSARTRGGVAVFALGVIVAVTAGWWALALYPVSGEAPEWLIRTRMACFGAVPGGLPNAGGWILLVGEPLGMFGVLAVVWGRELAEDLRRMAARSWGRATLAVASGSMLWGVVAAGQVVGRVWQRTSGAESFSVSDSTVAPVTVPAVPPLALVNQRGEEFDLAALSGRPVLVTFAYSHCETVCPTVVHRVLELRDKAGRSDIPLVVVTVDPWRDVPSRLGAMAEGWGLATADLVLGGDVERVNATLDAWGLGRSRDNTTGDVAHAVLVVLVDRAHRSATRVMGNVMQLSALLRDI